jgi:hypothetical protein
MKLEALEGTTRRLDVQDVWRMESSSTADNGITPTRKNLTQFSRPPARYSICNIRTLHDEAEDISVKNRKRRQVAQRHARDVKSLQSRAP